MIEVVVEAVKVLLMKDIKIDIGFNIDNPELWTIDKPNMYLAHVILESAEDAA